MYQSENLLRFSVNIRLDSPLIEYDVFPGLSLRLDFSDIVVDVLWTSRGELGCVVCLEKVLFIN